MTKHIHDKFIYERRMNRLAEILLEYIPHDTKDILDIGCGDGRIDALLLEMRGGITIKGMDVLIRDKSYIPVIKYDGKHIPMQDSSVDTVMLVDVLHHTKEPQALLKEAARAAKKYVIIKDHIKSGLSSYVKLRLMDYVGNAHYQVALPYNYLTLAEWKHIFRTCRLKVEKSGRYLNLYTGAAHLLFDGSLHFAVRLNAADMK